MRVGITTFLSGPASVFGVPAKQAAEMLFEEVNKAGGIGGIPVKAFFVDEAPGTDHLVGEYRRLVQNEGVHIVFASISSGSCLACTPLSDEMKKTTLLWDCGTQRIFEEGPHPYAFRTQGYGTPEVLAPLLYLLKHKPDFKTLAVINQDYAWGRDSWEMWKAGMDALKPGVRVVAEMFPRFGATDYSTEVTRLLAARPDVVLSTSWGGDLVTLVRQATERKLFDRSTFVLPVAEASLQTLGRNMASGHIIGARGDHWNNHPKPKDLGAAGEIRRRLQGEVQRIPDLPLPPHGPGDLRHAGRLRQGDRGQGRRLAERPGTGQCLPRPDLRHADLLHHPARGRPGARGPDRRHVHLHRPLPLRGAEGHGDLPRRHGLGAGGDEERGVAEVAEAGHPGADGGTDRGLGQHSAGGCAPPAPPSSL
ncbi:ABC transporter substrate-binding protein [Dankookia sp. P2]|uniref:ABC transporter substrate-binding protein n=1 Tax=Dankookia sp. P2 TaxID=3423955 RepID=UPI003D66DFBB